MHDSKSLNEKGVYMKRVVKPYPYLFMKRVYEKKIFMKRVMFISEKGFAFLKA